MVEDVDVDDLLEVAEGSEEVVEGLVEVGVLELDEKVVETGVDDEGGGGGDGGK